MQPINQLLINKLCEGKSDAAKTRKAIAAGEYAVDLALHVKGTLSISEDYERTPTVAIPLIETLALFVARSGATRDASISLLVSCITDALLENEGKAAGELAANVPQIAETIEAVKKNILAKLPKAKCAGPVKLNVKVLEITTETFQPAPIALAQVASVAQTVPIDA